LKKLSEDVKTVKNFIIYIIKKNFNSPLLLKNKRFINIVVSKFVKVPIKTETKTEKKGNPVSKLQ